MDPIEIREDDGFLRIGDVLKLVPVSSATIWRWVKNQSFPSPQKLSTTGRTVGWKVSSVRAWLASRH